MPALACAYNPIPFPVCKLLALVDAVWAFIYAPPQDSLSFLGLL